MREGTQKVDVTYEGLNVPRSPFSVNVVPGCDPSRVRAYGPGNQHSIYIVLFSFNVNSLRVALTLCQNCKYLM